MTIAAPFCHRLHVAAVALAAAIVLVNPARADQLTVEWTTQYGTSGWDSANDIAVDALGQLWVSGTSDPQGAENDATLTRLSSTGNVEFTRVRGGTGNDFGSGVCLFDSSTVFVGVASNSGSFDGTSLGGWDALLMRY